MAEKKEEKRGGARPFSGRPCAGRTSRGIRLTEDEYKKVLAYARALRVETDLKVKEEFEKQKKARKKMESNSKKKKEGINDGNTKRISKAKQRGSAGGISEATARGGSKQGR